MSPRTPASIVLGTAVTVSLFGLMHSMVGEREAFPPPPQPPLDPFVAVAELTPVSPPITRRVPDMPETPQRPEEVATPSTWTVDAPAGPGDGPVVPPFQPTHDGTTFVTDLGPPGSREHAAACGESQPRLLVTPEYPRAQRAAGVEGEVVVAFRLAPDGRVLDPRIVRATPRGAFESATLRAVRQWRFEATSAGCPHSGEERTESVTYRLDGVEE